MLYKNKGGKVIFINNNLKKGSLLILNLFEDVFFVHSLYAKESSQLK